METAKIIGMTTAIVSIIILGIVTTVVETRISKKENKINDLENKKEISFLNWQDHQRYNLQELLYRQDLYLTMILDDTQGSKDKRDKLTKETYTQEISAIEDSMINARLKALNKWFTSATGDIPPKKLKKQWREKTRKELKEEEEKIAIEGNEKLNALFAEIKGEKAELENLKRLRIIFILVSIFSQVIGLILMDIYANPIEKTV